MGYGKNLEKILKDHNTNVKDICNQTGIKPTTLYSAIQRDVSVSYANAIKIYLKLSPKFDLRSICDDVPADDPTLYRTPLTEYLKIGKKMKTARIRAGLEIAETAKLLNLTQSSYEDFEEGYRQPHTEILLNFCSVVSLSMEDLLGLKIDKSIIDPKNLSVYHPFGTIRPLFSENDTIIVIFYEETSDKSLEVPASHRILDKMADCNVLQICTMQGKDGKEHLAVRLED